MAGDRTAAEVFRLLSDETRLWAVFEDQHFLLY
jgi:hypothetical protein